MTPIDLAAIRDRDAKTDYWQVTGGSVVCADRRALLKFVDAITAAFADAKRVASEQADDAGLWFCTETATEAYLQQALRRLHRAVEGTMPCRSEAQP